MISLAMRYGGSGVGMSGKIVKFGESTLITLGHGFLLAYRTWLVWVTIRS
jgi:hypothetical protein